MARIMLILPHLPQRMGSPYLGQQYIAASLLEDGHEVRCLDLAAVYWEGDDADAVAEVERWGPDIIGMTLFTYNALRGYTLCERLSHLGCLTVAGGPHATVDPKEPLEFGFDVAVSGEGELAIKALARWYVEGGKASEPLDFPGVHFKDHAGAPRASIDDLDALAFPLQSYPSYESKWYSPVGHVVPGGLMTSRGCPARCTFCANYVTGRAYRWRSAEDVVAEMILLKERYDVRHFPFWDDAFTARRRRLNEVCDAILAEPALKGVTWTCITPGNMVKPRDLERMREAGCNAVNFGIESGDYNILKIIQKGQRPEHTRAAVAAAKNAGMLTIVNFMFGFPQEGVPELQRTLDFMQELSEHTDYFNNRGVLVPFPGTAIYDRWHETYGFTKWWLDPSRIIDEPNIHVLDPREVQTYLEIDPSLDLDFFNYSDDVREIIAECVRFKARHNARTLQRMRERYSQVPQRPKLPSANDDDPNARAEVAPRTTLELQQKTAASVG